MVLELGGEAARADAVCAGVADVRAASRDVIAPYTSGRYRAYAERALSRGATVLTTPELGRSLPADVDSVWVHEAAGWALARLLERVERVRGEPRIDPSARVDPRAVLVGDVTVGPRVTIGPFAVVGMDGFGWAHGPAGELVRVPHMGGVVIEADVEIGAMATVAAGTLRPTRIGRGTKLDAHVHIGHNADIGEDCFFAAQVGLAGSVVVGNGVRFGGQAGVADHVIIGDGATVCAKAGVIGDVESGATVAGYPAVPRWRWLRAMGKLLGARGGRDVDR